MRYVNHGGRLFRGQGDKAFSVLMYTQKSRTLFEAFKTVEPGLRMTVSYNWWHYRPLACVKAVTIYIEVEFATSEVRDTCAATGGREGGLVIHVVIHLHYSDSTSRPLHGIPSQTDFIGQ